MNKHTAGPWKINKNIGRKGEIGILADSAPCIICIMGNAKEWPIEARANAALIAACPDMLEALKVALDAYRDLYEAIENGADITEIYEDEKYWPISKVRAAIAKAEGMESC